MPFTRLQPEHEEIDHFAFALHEHFCLKTDQMLGCVEYKMYKVYLNVERILAELICKYWQIFRMADVATAFSNLQLVNDHSHFPLSVPLLQCVGQ